MPSGRAQAGAVLRGVVTKPILAGHLAIMSTSPFSRTRSDAQDPDHPHISAAADSSEAFDALVREHYGRLCAFAYRIVRSRETAEDVVHDVLLHIWRDRERFEFRDPLAYLYRSVRNRITSHHRNETGRGRLLAEASASEAVPMLGGGKSVDTAGMVESDDLARAAACAVDTLPERCRLIFTMRREQGLSYAEIARALDLSVKTVENQMNRAGKLLRARLSGYLGVAVALTSSAAEVWRRVGT